MAVNLPGIAGPPMVMRQNETPQWQDVPVSDEFDNEYDSGTYTLSYVFAGAASGPVTLTAAPSAVGVSGEGWITTFDPVNSGKMVPGKYWWQAILTYTNPPVPAGTVAELVPAEGEILVEIDLRSQVGPYDGRTKAEIGLDNAENALLVFQASGGRVKQYNVAGREMTFQDDLAIMKLVNYFRGRVEAEKQKRTGGDRRKIRVGFAPPSSGTQTATSKNWPWW